MCFPFLHLYYNTTATRIKRNPPGFRRSNPGKRLRRFLAIVRCAGADQSGAGRSAYKTRVASYSSIEAAEQDRLDNATYMTFSGATALAKVRTFIEACTYLMDRKPMEASQGSVRDRYESIANDLRKAQEFAAAQQSSDNTDSGTTTADLSGGW